MQILFAHSEFFMREFEMPVYVYECDECGKRFEEHRHYGAPHPKICPDGHEGIHRIFSPPTIIFKGSGFYVTDNAQKNGRAIQRPAKDQESTKPEKKETKVEAKEQDKS
jgi:putative FmdB family regulatory protein